MTYLDKVKTEIKKARAEAKKIRAEFIPLSYDAIGRIIDSCGNFRKVKAIPYGLGLVEVRNEYLEGTHRELEIVRKYFLEKMVLLQLAPFRNLRIRISFDIQRYRLHELGKYL